MTPKVFYSQLEVHREVQAAMNSSGTKQKAPTTQGYIDQLKGW